MSARRWAAGIGVAAVALVAAVMSYEHQRILAAEHGQPELLAALWPLGVDGLILACGIQLATDRAAGYRPRVWAVVGFWLGVVVSVAANALATPGGVVARMISAFPAVALLIAVESLTTGPRKRKLPAEVAAEVWAPEPAEASTKLPVIPAEVPAEASQVTPRFPVPVLPAAERKPRPEITLPVERKPAAILSVKRSPETTWKAAQDVMTAEPELPLKDVAARVGVTDRRLRQIRTEMTQTVSA